MPSPKDRLNELRKRVSKGEDKGNLTTSLFYLIKELKCLSDVVGREFEVIYDGDKIVKIVQKPMKIPTLITLFDEMEKDYRKQEREMKKAKRKR